MTAGDDTLEFRILGPFRVSEGGEPLEVGVGKQRALLALLVLRAGEVVSTDRLIDALWEDRPPASALNSVHIYVSQLRKALGNRRLETRGHGYLLALEPEQLDLARFERLLGEGRALLGEGEAERAAETLRAALALWRGPPLSDFASEPFAHGEIARLEELRLAALEERIEADLALGRHAELVSELEALVRQHPLRERLRAQLMLALYRSGRQAEALAAYQQARRTLAEELGLEPGRRLQELEHAILRQDAQLDPPRQAATPLGRARRKSGVLIAIGAVLLLSAATAVAGIELARRGSSAVTIGPTSLTVIDPDSSKIVGAIELGFKSNLIAAGEGHVWVVDPTGSTLWKIDPRARRVAGIFPLAVGAGEVPFGLAVGGAAVWVAVLRGESQVVLELGPDHGDLRLTIPYGQDVDAAYLARLNPLTVGGGAVWAIDAAVGGLWRIDPRTGRKRKLTEGLDALSLAAGRGAVWVAGSAGVTKFDALTGLELGSTSLGSQTVSETSSVALGADAAWATGSTLQTLSKIDEQTIGTTETFAVGRGPSGVAVGEGAVWVANSRDGTVSRVDPGGGEPETIELGSPPGGIAVAYGAVWTSPGEPRG